jgi:hypothetical protein
MFDLLSVCAWFSNVSCDDEVYSFVNFRGFRAVQYVGMYLVCKRLL